jgi:hypothetical protein
MTARLLRTASLRYLWASAVAYLTFTVYLAVDPFALDYGRAVWAPAIAATFWFWEILLIGVPSVGVLVLLVRRIGQRSPSWAIRSAWFILVGWVPLLAVYLGLWLDAIAPALATQAAFAIVSPTRLPADRSSA